MRRLMIIPGLFVVLLMAAGGSDHAPASDAVIAHFKRVQPDFAAKTLLLQERIRLLDKKDTQSVYKAREALWACRVSYKQLAFFLEYFFPGQAYVFNSPAKYEMEEPFVEYEEPVGLQQIEALLYDTAVYRHKQALEAQAVVMVESATDLPSLLYRFSATDKQVLESIQIELIRVMTLYITGFDAPLLKSGIAESAAAMRAMDAVLVGDSIHYYMKVATAFLDAGTGFDSFDRLRFLKEYALPLQRLLSGKDLFSPSFLEMPGKTGGDTQLGRALFSAKVLSADNTRSCASCHQPALLFTDGQYRNTVINGDSLLPRHTPGLLYSCYQYAQFWDGRAQNLEDQALAVLHNRQEMNMVDDTLLLRLQQQYGRSFTMDEISSALAAYLRTLAPFSSPFDRYMQGDALAMTAQQQKGYNVFMGKAQCGTCHFAPLFNGLIPPLYNRTEFEVLGTPANEDLDHPLPDKDRGRAAFFPVEFYEGAFKTPTVRNTATTAPYMHNGAFSSMERVIDFYDRGGGNGIGMAIPDQTLGTARLGLSEEEKKALIAFMEALTDK